MSNGDSIGITSEIQPYVGGDKAIETYGFLLGRMDAVLQEADQYRIVDSDSYVAANGILQAAKAIKKEVVEFVRLPKQKIDAVKDSVLALEKRVKLPMDDCIQEIGAKMAAWDREQERIRQEEQARIRKEHEAKELARLKAEREQEEESKLRAAEVAEAKGDVALAEQILDSPVEVDVAAYVPEPIVPKSTPKLAGTTYRVNWKYRIIDKSLIPSKYWKLDETRIGVDVRADKERTNIPGIEVYSEKIPVGTKY